MKKKYFWNEVKNKKNKKMAVNFWELLEKSVAVFLKPEKRAFIWYSICNDPIMLTRVESRLNGSFSII